MRKLSELQKNPENEEGIFFKKNGVTLANIALETGLSQMYCSNMLTGSLLMRPKAEKKFKALRASIEAELQEEVGR